MQVALPRTQDAGKLQDQMQQRGPNVQQSLAEAGKIHDDLRRNQVNSMESKNGVNVNSNEDTTLLDSSKETHHNDVKVNVHPYLGNEIDYSG